MFFCSFVFLCVTSSVSFTGFYTEDEPSFLLHRRLITLTCEKCVREDIVLNNTLRELVIVYLTLLLMSTSIFPCKTLQPHQKQKSDVLMKAFFVPLDFAPSVK